MFDIDFKIVKSKTVRRKPDMLEVEDITITSDYHCFVSVTSTAYIIFVNSMPFLIILYPRIQLLTLKHILSRMSK